MKDVLWCGLLELVVPHKGDAVRLVRRVFVIVVGGNQQLGVLSRRRRSGDSAGEQLGTYQRVPHLRGPVQAGDHAMLGPVLVIEESAQSKAGPGAQVSGKKETKLTLSLAQWCLTRCQWSNIFLFSLSCLWPDVGRW